MLKLFPIAVLFLTFAGLSTAQEIKEFQGVKYTEEHIVFKVLADVGFFSTDIQMIDMSALLWMPANDSKALPPLVISNHGSQDGGTSLEITPSRTWKFLARGYGVLAPIRKGFNAKGYPSSKASVNKTEPVSCGIQSSSESGVKSAIADVTDAIKALKERGTKVDFTKIVLTGASRGGFLSLALAASEFPGVVSVINFAGGWYSERCYADFNVQKFRQFGESIKVPTLSFYGDRDNYYSIHHIRQNLESLKKIPNSADYILPGATHFVMREVDQWWPIVEKHLDQVEGKGK